VSGLQDARTYSLLFPALIHLPELAEHIEHGLPRGTLERESPEWIADFLGSRSRELSWGLSADFFPAKVACGFLLLDGLSEVPDAERASLVRLIENASALWPQSRIVVTSRPPFEALAGFHVETVATINS
jgi:hypothetical protein